MVRPFTTRGNITGINVWSFLSHKTPNASVFHSVIRLEEKNSWKGFMMTFFNKSLYKTVEFWDCGSSWNPADLRNDSSLMEESTD